MPTLRKMTAADLAEFGFRITPAEDRIRQTATLKSVDTSRLRPDRPIGRFVAELKKRIESYDRRCERQSLSRFAETRLCWIKRRWTTARFCDGWSS